MTRRIDIDRLVADGFYKPSHIAGNLYQGGAPTIGPHLRASGVDCLVLCAFGFQGPREDFPGVEVHHAPGDDTDVNWIEPATIAAWEAAAQWAAHRAVAGKTVLVTCQKGWNRSGFVTALALRLLTGWSGAKCVDLVQWRRPKALCNRSFARWIAKLPECAPLPEPRATAPAAGLLDAFGVPLATGDR